MIHGSTKASKGLSLVEELKTKIFAKNYANGLSCIFKDNGFEFGINAYPYLFLKSLGFPSSLK